MCLLKYFKKRNNEIIAKFQERDILLISKEANYFGQESLGLKQIRGNGVLILTPEKLFFEMYSPKRKLAINLDSIFEIEKTKWHLKKTKGVPLFKVYFFDEKGEKDSVAWIVKDTDLWITHIEQLLEKKSKN